MENDLHKQFLQYMLNKGISSVEDAIQFLNENSEETMAESHLKKIIVEVNRSMSKLHFKIHFQICEITDKNFIIFMSLKDDNISKLQKVYTHTELEYFNTIMKEIIEDEEHCITFPRCLNLSSYLKQPMSREDGETVFNIMMKGGYFVKEGQNVYLGPRTILEFRSIIERLGHICGLCSELMVTGKICGECNQIFHRFCITKYHKKNNTCPNCKKIWKELTRCTEDSNSDGSENSTTESQKRKRKRGRSVKSPAF